MEKLKQILYGNRLGNEALAQVDALLREIVATVKAHAQMDSRTVPDLETAFMQYDEYISALPVVRESTEPEEAPEI
jgi:hypothetical protein